MVLNPLQGEDAMGIEPISSRFLVAGGWLLIENSVEESPLQLQAEHSSITAPHPFITIWANAACVTLILTYKLRDIRYLIQ